MDKITHKVRCEQWTSIIKECLASGMPKTTWCREHGISDKAFFLLATNSPRRSIPYYIREGSFGKAMDSCFFIKD